MFNPLVQGRYKSSYSISFPDFPTFDIIPQSIKVFQETGVQDVIEITYPRFSSFYSKILKTGVPVSISYGNDKLSTDWFGYVYDVKTSLNQSLSQPIVVRCIGASLSLKEGGSKIWANKTASDIVTDIATRFKLKPVVTPHKTIFSQQSLSGHTYWEKIQELASRIGYAAHVIGTELHFHPLDVMIDKFMTTIPTLSYLDGTLPPFSQIEDQTLDVFKATLTDYSDSQSSKRKEKNVYGIDPVTSKFYFATSSPNTVGKNLRMDSKDPLFKEVISGAVSGSKEMAQVIADAHAQFARFTMHARGAGQGDPRIAPFRTVEVAGTGDETDGFWVIKEATHFIAHDGRYEVEFQCMTDGRGNSISSATRPSASGLVPTRNIALELATGSSGTPTSTKLSGATTLVNQTDTGFNVTPRRWVGM